jgi:uncharacterized protein (TIGR02996 family)
MAEPKELTAFFEALEDDPGDAVTLLALADWLDEGGESAKAECLRWLAKEGKAPYRYHRANELLYHHETWQEGWWWWTTDREKSPWGYPESSSLPHRLWKKMKHSFSYDPCVFKEYHTVRGALQAVLEVWDRPTQKPQRKREV